VSLEVLSDTIQPFPTFSEVYASALEDLRSKIAAGSVPAGASVP
jgi:dihydrolipoamide dehydrogenase